MDIFALRDRLVADYEESTRRSNHIRDDHIRAVVERGLPEGGRGLASFDAPLARAIGCVVAQRTPRVVDP